MRNFNFRLFFIITLVLSVVAYLSFNAAYGRDEGTLGTDLLRNFLADLFNIMRFPAHVLLPGFFRIPFAFALGLILNCVIYGIALERVAYFIYSLFHKENVAE